ncbi:uncharacterized protein LOC128799773 isoform X2 [Vidua chalybeata]|uniref:uncharacterized protein LOC128799773 isoform X2 n=1 Tax=Vidua chalybeata TaxID=81927 RepID=UPI0023A7C9F5|nr:uncharacterized protein LOC128799773 isoform X2 [Vidua chalybeata]
MPGHNPAPPPPRAVCAFVRGRRCPLKAGSPSRPRRFGGKAPPPLPALYRPTPALPSPPIPHTDLPPKPTGSDRRGPPAPPAPAALAGNGPHAAPTPGACCWGQVTQEVGLLPREDIPHTWHSHSPCATNPAKDLHHHFTVPLTFHFSVQPHSEKHPKEQPPFPVQVNSGFFRPQLHVFPAMLIFPIFNTYKLMMEVLFSLTEACGSIPTESLDRCTPETLEFAWVTHLHHPLTKEGSQGKELQLHLLEYLMQVERTWSGKNAFFE